uniref:Uncharacterized protein n=1 Tax=Rhizophora mucronata TaxID=61149 RepID=A0A2P2JXX6_RHIMU
MLSCEVVGFGKKRLNCHEIKVRLFAIFASLTTRLICVSEVATINVILGNQGFFSPFPFLFLFGYSRVLPAFLDGSCSCLVQ